MEIFCSKKVKIENNLLQIINRPTRTPVPLKAGRFIKPSAHILHPHIKGCHPRKSPETKGPITYTCPQIIWLRLNKVAVLKGQTKTRKTIFPTMITTYGELKNNHYSGLVQAEVYDGGFIQMACL